MRIEVLLSERVAHRRKPVVVGRGPGLVNKRHGVAPLS